MKVVAKKIKILKWILLDSNFVISYKLLKIMNIEILS